MRIVFRMSGRCLTNCAKCMICSAISSHHYSPVGVPGKESRRFIQKERSSLVATLFPLRDSVTSALNANRPRSNFLVVASGTSIFK